MNSLTCHWRLPALGALTGWVAGCDLGDEMKPPDLNSAMMVPARPIGVVDTPFQDPAGTPIQPSRAKGTFGTVRVHRAFAEGLQDLAGFERIWLIYWLHKAPEGRLLVTPFLDR
jgi:hypothetical protein